MRKEELKSIIVEQASRKRLPDKAIKREVFLQLEKFTLTPFIVCVTGLRRVGKSTIIQQLAAAREAKGYFLNFDDERLIHFTVEDFQMLNEAFYELYGSDGDYYFDEIQNIPGWERFARRLHDDGKKVFITGSNASLLSSELGTHLTGRYIQIELYPFSFSEYITYQRGEIDKTSIYTIEEKTLLRNLFSDYLSDGGLPEFIKTKEEYYLHALYENIVYRDIVSRYSIKKEQILKELVHYLISNSGKEFSFNSLRKVLGLSNAETVKEYIGYLQNSYMFFTVNRFDYSLKRQIQSPKKIYAVDLALGQSVSFSFSQDQGRKIENIVFLQLKRQGMDVYYHRAKKECDFLLVDRGKVVNAIQVTVSIDDSDTRQRELEGLHEAMSIYQLSEGTILTFDEEDEFSYMGFKVNVIPIWKWLLK